MFYKSEKTPVLLLVAANSHLRSGEGPDRDRDKEFHMIPHRLPTNEPPNYQLCNMRPNYTCWYLVA